MIPMKRTNERKYVLHNDDEDQCDLKSICSISSMSTGSCITTEEELMIMAYAQLKSAASFPLSPEAHDELDQLVIQMNPTSPTTVTASLDNGLTTRTRADLKGLMQVSRSKLKACRVDKSDDVSTCSYISQEQSMTTTTTGITIGSGTTRHHANGMNKLYQKKKRNAYYQVPHSISMSCSSGDAESSQHDDAIDPASQQSLARLKNPENSMITEATSETESGQKPSALGFVQSFFNCCSAHHVVDDSMPMDFTHYGS